MKLTTSLALIAIGAILTFAVSVHMGVLNLKIVGIVIMVVGVAGLFLPRGRFGWVRRRVVVRQDGEPVGHVDEERYPSYVMINPAALDAVQAHGGTVVSDELDDLDDSADSDDEIAENEIRPRNAKSPHGSEMVADVYEE